MFFDGPKLGGLVEPYGAPPLGEGGAICAISAFVGAFVVPHLDSGEKKQEGTGGGGDLTIIHGRSRPWGWGGGEGGGGGVQ